MKKLFLFCIITIFYMHAYEEPAFKPPPQEQPPVSFSWLDESYFSTSVDFLYWKVEESGLDFVYTDSINNPPNYGGLGDIERGTFEWHPGFRVALSYNFKPDYWKIAFEYDNFVPRGIDKVSQLNSQILTGTFPSFTSTNLAWAKSDISLRCHIGDLFLQKDFQISKKIAMGFLTGIKGIWFKQNWNVTYEGQQLGGFRQQTKPKWRFKGVGLKAGMNVDWQINWGLSWSALTSLAAIFGNYDNRTYLFREDIFTGDRLVFQNTHYDDFRVVENVQLAMGPSYEKAFHHWGIKLRAFYEINLFFNIHQVDRDEFFDLFNLNPQTRTVMAMMQMHGLTMQLLLSF